MPKQVFSTPGTHTFTVPTGIISIIVECWGGGGSGGDSSNGGAASGGSGGSYAKKTMTVTPGTNYTVVVGAGGLYSNGSDSWFSTTGTALAKGGRKGNDAYSAFEASPVNGIAGSIGDVTYTSEYSNIGLAYNGQIGWSGGGGAAAGSTGANQGYQQTPAGVTGTPVNGYGLYGGSGGYSGELGYGYSNDPYPGYPFGGGGGAAFNYPGGWYNQGQQGGDGGVVVSWADSGNSNFFSFFN